MCLLVKCWNPHGSLTLEMLAFWTKFSPWISCLSRGRGDGDFYRKTFLLPPDSNTLNFDWTSLWTQQLELLTRSWSSRAPFLKRGKFVVPAGVKQLFFLQLGSTTKHLMTDPKRDSEFFTLDPRGFWGSETHCLLRGKSLSAYCFLRLRILNNQIATPDIHLFLDWIDFLVQESSEEHSSEVCPSSRTGALVERRPAAHLEACSQSVCQGAPARRKTTPAVCDKWRTEKGTGDQCREKFRAQWAHQHH